MFLDAFGPIWIHSELFGCVRMRLDAFGNKWRVSEKFVFFLKLFATFSIFFRCFMECFEHYAKFHAFLDVLDNFSYLLSLVIYREPPLTASQSIAKFDQFSSVQFSFSSVSVSVQFSSVSVQFSFSSVQFQFLVSVQYSSVQFSSLQN